jgi:hypothetical protein
MAGTGVNQNHLPDISSLPADSAVVAHCSTVARVAGRRTVRGPPRAARGSTCGSSFAWHRLVVRWLRPSSHRCRLSASAGLESVFDKGPRRRQLGSAVALPSILIGTREPPHARRRAELCADPTVVGGVRCSRAH